MCGGTGGISGRLGGTWGNPDMAQEVRVMNIMLAGM